MTRYLREEVVTVVPLEDYPRRDDGTLIGADLWRGGLARVVFPDGIMAWVYRQCLTENPTKE